MIKLLYKSVNLIASMLGGLLAGLIFKGAWKIIGRGDEAPKPTDEQQGWGEILLAATLQGAIFAVVKAAFDRGAAEVTRKLTGVSPGDEASSPASRPGHRQATATARMAE
jgi:hypothetical protein